MKEDNNPFLRLVSGNQTVSISACRGGETANLAHAWRTFTGHVDPDFKKYGCNTPQPATEKTNVDIYQMYNRSGDFKTLLSSLSSDFKTLAFQSQEQIEMFAREHRQWIRTDGYGTFFLFTEVVKEEEKFFVANVYISSGELRVGVFHLLRRGEWFARHAYRFVVPTTIPLEPQS